MDDSGYHHRWRPIEDIIRHDLSTADDELMPLADVWRDIRTALPEQRVRDFNERLKREWAIETGIIERLYTLAEGTTELLIEQGIDAALIAHDASDQQPEFVAGLINDHAEAMDWLFDIVAQRRPLTASTIKQLHQLMTRKQRTCAGVDSLGREVEVPLLHGEYKQWPNNPTRPDGLIHEYCPPEQVGSEMERLITLHDAHGREKHSRRGRGCLATSPLHADPSLPRWQWSGCTRHRLAGVPASRLVSTRSGQQGA